MNKITLPKPVSVNALYRVSCKSGYAKTYISDKGQAWFKEAGHRLLHGNKGRYTDRDVIVYVWLYTCRDGDIDNVGKCTLDLLQHSGVILNDKQVVELHMYKERVKHVKDEKMELQVEMWE